MEIEYSLELVNLSGFTNLIVNNRATKLKKYLYCVWRPVNLPNESSIILSRKIFVLPSFKQRRGQYEVLCGIRYE